MRPKIGLALGGGGAKGFAHIGVLKVLIEAGIPIDLVTGTSAGGIVGAFWATGRTPDEMMTILRGWNLLSLLGRDPTGRSLFGNDRYRRRLQQALGAVTLEQLPRKLAVVAVDLKTRQEVVLTQGDLVTAVLATSAFPGIFPPIELSGQLLADGGILNNLPVDVARRLGADRVIAISLGGRDVSQPPASADLTPTGQSQPPLVHRLFRTAARQPAIQIINCALDIMGDQLQTYRLAKSPPDLLLVPDLKGSGLFDLDRANATFAAGETEARAALPAIQALLTPGPAPRLPDWWRQFTARLPRLRVEWPSAQESP